jgi:hypothetical protein
MEIICQFGIPILSCIVAYNVTSLDPKRRIIGYWCGIFSQPMWYFTTLHAKQYGLFILSLWYTYRWIEGIRTHWSLR